MKLRKQKAGLTPGFFMYIADMQIVSEIDFDRYKTIGFEPTTGKISELLDFYREKYDWHIFGQMVPTKPLKTVNRMQNTFEWFATVYDIKNHIWLLEKGDDGSFYYTTDGLNEDDDGFYTYDNYAECIEAACIWLCKTILTDNRFDENR